MLYFIAGTAVLTAAGLVAIESLVPGDKIIATDLDTLETGEKTILETYVRQVSKPVQLTVNGEEIVTTDNHPFYVQSRDFIEAGSLLVGDKLVGVNGEDFYTYFVGNWNNIDCDSIRPELPEFDGKTPSGGVWLHQTENKYHFHLVIVVIRLIRSIRHNLLHM